MTSRACKRYLLLSTIICFLIQYRLAAQVSVTSGHTAQQLAQKLGGPGVQIMNPTLNCASVANGIFTVTSSNLGLDSGIVLTSGKASSTNGIGVNGNEGALASTNNQTAGDAQLSTLAGSGTHDACILEFDFIPKGDSIKFNYVFSSEEYVNSTCGPYNDVFAFFISGPSITGQQNMALVPGTNIPVTINSINSGIPGPNGDIANCLAMGPGSPFTQYYVNNAGGTTITHNGFTKVLQAIHAVTPCNTYHLKMAIADAGNALYDSGVFLEAGSLKANIPAISAMSTATATIADTPFFVKGCSTGGFVISRPQATAAPQTIHYNIGGTAVNGTDYATIADSIVIPANTASQQLNITALATPPSGPKSITLFIKSPFACNVANQVVDSATLLIYDSIHARIITPDTTICEHEVLPLEVDALGPYSYVWSPDSSLSNGNAQNPFAMPTQTTTYTMTAYWQGSGCSPVVDTVRVNVLPVPAIDAGNTIYICPSGDIQLKVSVDPFDPAYTYGWSGPDSFSASTQTPIIHNATTANSGTYIVAVGVNNGCPAQRDSVEVQIVPPPPPPQLPSAFFLCRATVLDHRGDLGSDLMWHTGATDTTSYPYIPLDDNTPEGYYTFYVSYSNLGCEGPRVKEHVSIRKCCEDNIFIPDAFTPNGDGKNDVFRVSQGDDHTVTELRIFDRWGEMVFQSYNTNAPWDGTCKGQPLEPGAYYYYMTIHCRIGTDLYKKGSIMLIR